MRLPLLYTQNLDEFKWPGRVGHTWGVSGGAGLQQMDKC